MAKLTNDQAERLTTGSGIFFQLKDDRDHAKVQIMLDRVEDIPAYSVHKVKIDDKYTTVSCLRVGDDPEDACPFCKAGIKREVQWYVPLFDIASQSVKFWSRGKTIRLNLAGIANHYSPMSSVVVDIERQGKAGSQQTKYGIYPLPGEQSYDLSQVEVPEIEGSVITLLSYDEMCSYLNHNPISGGSENIRPRGSAQQSRPAVPAGDGFRRTPAGQETSRRF